MWQFPPMILGEGNGSFAEKEKVLSTEEAERQAPR